jgi:hypothetical protein
VEWGRNWKLELRYGRRTTPYTHYSAIAEGQVGQLADGFSCRPGPAVMGMRMWALSADEASDMLRAIAAQLGFTPSERVYVYVTEPVQPPGENPHGYDIQFTPFDPDAR